MGGKTLNSRNGWNWQRRVDKSRAAAASFGTTRLWHNPTDGHFAKFWDRFRFIHWSAFGRGEDFFASIICVRTPACLRTEEGFASKGRGWSESRRIVSLSSRAKQHTEVARSGSGCCVGFPALRHQQGKKKNGDNECKDGPTRKRDRPPFFLLRSTTPRARCKRAIALTL
jgi:hypothetical protein